MVMNIILFTSAANTSGGSRQALYLAQGLAARGHSVLFFVPGHSTLPSLAPEASFWRRFTSVRTWKQEIESAMKELSGNGGPTIIHAFHNAAVKKAAWWGLFWKKKALVVAHRGVIFQPNNPLPYWSPGVDGFLVNSKACVRILRRIGVSPKRLFYVPNCVPDNRLAITTHSEQLRASLNISPGAPLFLCIGGNKEYKGVKELLQAFAKVCTLEDSSSQSAPHVVPHLVVLGVDPARWALLTQRLGIDKQTNCLGKTEDVGSYLAAATAFVLPSLSESMPNTLLEAVRAGLPSIGTEVGAVPDILSGQGSSPCGLLVPPADVSALAFAMRRMLTDTKLRTALAASALQEGENYRPKKRIDLVEDIYTQLLRNKGLL